MIRARCATRDIDLLSRTGDLDESERALRGAAALDLGDYFTCTLNPGRRIAQGVGAVRVDVVAFLGLHQFASFHVDLVADLLMTGVPDAVSPLVAIELPGLVVTSYSTYPLVDHVADKVCALLETHERASGLRQPSTRFRDLADLAIFAHTIAIEAVELGVALKSEACSPESHADGGTQRHCAGTRPTPVERSLESRWSLTQVARPRCG